MARIYTTQDGDMLDLICYRAYAGKQSGVVEVVLEANQVNDLSSYGAVLPRGLTITLPDLAAPALRAKPLVSLW